MSNSLRGISILAHRLNRITLGTKNVPRSRSEVAIGNFMNNCIHGRN